MKDLNSNLALAIVAAALGSGFQHGYNTGVLNAPQKVIELWIKGPCPGSSLSSVSDRECLDEYTVTLIWSWVVAIYCIGGMMGGAIVGLVSSYFGRKGGLMFNNLFVLIASLLMGFAKEADSYQMLLAGRLFAGINSGLNAGLVPMYLSEVSPVSLRGSTGTVYQLIITLSILLSQVLGLQQVLGTEDKWPILLGGPVILGILQLLLLPWCPESPRFLLMDRFDSNGSTKALSWLRKSDKIESEIEEMNIEFEAKKLEKHMTLKEMLTVKYLRKPLAIAVMMMLAQQLSGINAAMFFSTKIFSSAGLNEFNSQMASVGMGVMNVLMTFVSMILIDVAGRKTLMISGLTVMFLSTTFLLISLLLYKTLAWMSYIAIASVILFVVGFATGPGSIPWFFVSELFAQSGRPIATSIAVAVNWSANFLVGLSFSPIQLAIGPYVFLIFMIIQVFFILYVQFIVPETKGRSVEQVTAKFRV